MTAQSKNDRTKVSKESLIIDRYVRLFLDHKLILLVIFLFITTVWTFLFPDIYRSRMIYTSTAIIRFDDPRISGSASGVDDSYTQMGAESKIGILSTRSFLTEVIDSLKLNIIIDKPRVTRNDIIHSLKIKEQTNFGKYTVDLDDSTLHIYYSSEDKSEEDIYLKSVLLPDSEYVFISLHSFDISFYVNIFDVHSKIELDFSETRYRIESLKGKLDIRSRGVRQTMLYINFSSKDAVFGAQITNTIAGLFLNRLLEFKKFKTSSVIESLSEQLEVSKKELEQSEGILQRFRERNPFITMNETAEQYSSELNLAESKISQLNSFANEVQRLLNDVSGGGSFDDRSIVFQQIITYLTDIDVAGSMVLRDQYMNELLSRENISENYSAGHPRILEADKNVSEIQNRIKSRAVKYISDISRQTDQISGGIRATEKQLRRLPQKEIALTKLQREREAKSTIYSNILTKYNEARVADVSITPDAFLLESADTPIIKPNIIKILVLFLIGPLFGLAIAIGIILLADILHHKARSGKDIEATLGLPVIANIPVIKSSTEIPKDFDAQKRVDPKLVTIDYTPSIESEAFRNLRTKLIMEKEGPAKRQIIISSLYPGDGKSLVAANLAITFAQLKKPTVLIDIDIRRGVQHSSFLCDKNPGISDLLSKNLPVNDENLAKIIQKTTIPNLFLISAGKPIPNPTELIIADKFEEIIKKLSERYSYLIFDTPPIEMIPDALVLNEKVHNLVLTVRYGKTDIGKLKNKLDEFTDIKDDIAGIVFNSSKNAMKKGYYSYSYYKY